jgi:DNA-binding winged helix-turn-helix (wHTH) protein/TolB-like protein
MLTEEQLREGFRIGDWEVLPLRGVLRNGEQEERPEPRVFGVLIALAKRNGDLVTRDELVDELWDGRPTSDEPINRCLSQLRGHLGDKSRPHRYVETLTRRGYRLVEPVELLKAVQGPVSVDAGTAVSSRWKPIVAGIAVAFVAWVVWTQIPPGDFGSIGVVPFENASLDPTNDYLVSGFKDELVHTLHNIPNLSVKSSRIPRSGQEAYEIANDLGVDAVLSGRVHRNDDLLQVFYTVEDGRTGDVIATAELSGPVDEIFALQEKLARMVRDDLFGTSTQQLITRTRPTSFGAYDRYMRGLYAFDKRQDGGRSLEEAIDLFQLAIETVEQGVRVDDSIAGAANAVFGLVYHREKRWSESEQAYIEATSANVVDPNAFNWYSRMLASVGRLDDSLQKARIAVEMDPTSAVFNSRVAVAYLWLGDDGNAAEFFERSEKFGATGPTYIFGYALFLLRIGEIEKAHALARQAAAVAGDAPNWIDPVFDGFADSSRTSKALAAVAAASADGQMSEQAEFIARSLLGDIDGALDVARMLQGQGEIFEMDLLFIPETEPLRNHPGFEELTELLGLDDYWSRADCSWIGAGLECSAG